MNQHPNPGEANHNEEPDPATATPADGRPDAPAQGPPTVQQQLADLTGQNSFLRHQVGQLHQAVRQLYDAVSLQCRQLLESDEAVKEELRKFQTGGPQRAMAGVFHKLFRELVQHIDHLDALAALGEQGERDPAERPWIDSLRVARDQFERTLGGWGCVPVAVRVGEEEFDPAVHEPAAAEPGEVPAGAPGGVVVKVRRRGWRLHDQVLRHPVVVVS